METLCAVHHVLAHDTGDGYTAGGVQYVPCLYSTPFAAIKIING